MKKEKIDIYVFGGVYTKGNFYEEKTREFCLVSPTNGEPYITKSIKFNTCADLTSNHSNIYKLNDDFKSVSLVEIRCNGIGCPDTAVLSENNRIGVLNRIKNNDYSE